MWDYAPIMKNIKFTWLILFVASSLLLILRVVDFIAEAVNDGFHMTRAGLSLVGTSAGLVQLFIILTSLSIFWIAISKLTHQNSILNAKISDL